MIHLLAEFPHKRTSRKYVELSMSGAQKSWANKFLYDEAEYF
jgi:hypothetical protein